MQVRKKMIRMELLAFLWLLSISVYRKLSIQAYPESPFRNHIVFLGYLILICLWMISVQTRITQKHIRDMLLAEASIMFFGILIRFIQEAYLQDNLKMLRFTGLLTCATLVPIMLLATYAVLGLGKGDSYRMPANWYLLSIPVLVITLFIVTDEEHHLIFRLLADEVQPNVAFHPNALFYLFCGYGVFLIILRSFIIFKFNDYQRSSIPLTQGLPLIHIGLIGIFSLPYVLSSFYGTMEVIEFFAGIYYLEGLSWEVYIFYGMVPVNMDYAGVFAHSTAGMQILEYSGKIFSKSHNASSLDQALLERLKEEGHVVLEGKELNLHQCSDSFLVWQRDVQALQQIRDSLKQSEQELLTEGELLSKEMRVRNEVTRIQAKNKIYSQLCEEMASQLSRMEELVKRCRNEQKQQLSYQKLLVIGTYMKRRSNLRLIQWEHELIPMEDIYLAYHDFMAAMEEVGIKTELKFLSKEVPLGYQTLERSEKEKKRVEFYLSVYDFMEKLLESMDMYCASYGVTVYDGRVEIEIKGTDCYNHDWIKSNGIYDCERKVQNQKSLPDASCQPLMDPVNLSLILTLRGDDYA